MRRIDVVLVAISLAVTQLASAGCSTLGTEGGTPEGLPHGGTGPYRDLETPETRLATVGLAVLPGEVAVDRGMVAGLHLFYAGAPPMAPVDAGMPDAGVPDDAAVLDDAGDPLDAGVVVDAGEPDAGPPETGDVPWDELQPRRIYRSAPTDSSWGYPSGMVVFEADEGWEGGYVNDPWAVELPDGSARLYYAAAGGIGVAEASAIDGTFTRASTGPILGLSDGAVPRCPSVVPTTGLSIEGAFYMVYELDGAIHGASSTDGVTFTPLGEIHEVPRVDVDGGVVETLPARDSRDGTEIGRGCPGAMVAHTAAQRSILRIYYESWRDNGAWLVGMLGTTDATTFEAYGVPMFTTRDRRMPAPREVDNRITIMLSWAPREVRMNQRGSVRIGVAPGGITLTGATR